MCATFSAAILTTPLSAEHSFAWGWRISFLIGFVLGHVGYYLRTRAGRADILHRGDLDDTVGDVPDQCAARYGFAVAILGGLAPYISTVRVRLTGNPLAPSFCVMVPALASGIAVLIVHERFRAPALA